MVIEMKKVKLLLTLYIWLLTKFYDNMKNN